MILFAYSCRGLVPRGGDSESCMAERFSCRAMRACAAHACVKLSHGFLSRALTVGKWR